MKRRVVIIISAICVLIAALAFGVIIANIATKDEQENTNNESNVEENIEKTDNEEKNIGQDVALNSKIGNEVLSKLLFPNLYSKALYSELDENGVSNDFKIMYIFSLMTTYQEYSSYLREGEDYIGNYITKKDLEKVAGDFFGDTSNLKHKAIFNEDETYNEETGNYVIVARGYEGSNLDFIVEIPYQITEYEDKIEVKSYRVYIESKSEDEMDLPTNTIYYDSEMMDEAVKIKDEKMMDETSGQQEMLNEYITSGKINKEKLATSIWTFTKKEGKYLMSDYKTE